MEQIYILLAQVCFIIILVLGIAVFSNAFKKPRFDPDGQTGGQIFIAWHTMLPGFVREYLPRHEINLQDLVLSGFLKSMDGRFEDALNPELRAARILQTERSYQKYQLTEKEGHYLLYRPEQIFWRISWRAEYKIGPWRRVKSK